METSLLTEDPQNQPVVEIPDGTAGSNLLIDWIRSELQLASPDVMAFRKHDSRMRRFFDGKQLSEEDEKQLEGEGRPHNAFNSAQKFIRFVTGIERNTDEALMCLPVDEEDEEQQAKAEYATRAYDWAIKKGKGNYERATAFEDLTIGGMGWEDYSIEHGRDPRGLPAMARFSPQEAWFPRTDRQNLEGSRWRGRETYVDVDEAEARWPGVKIKAGRPGTNKSGTVDRTYPQERGITEYTIFPIETKPLNPGDLGGDGLNKVRIMQFEWWDEEQGYYFYDPTDQEDTWLSAGDFFSYRRKLRNLHMPDVVDYVKQTSRQYKRIFLLDQQFQLGEIIKLQRFHLNCMTGSWDAEARIWYGYFSVLVDPQRFSNKFLNQIIEITGYAAKGGGYLYEKGAVSPKQVEDLIQNYAKPGTWNEVNNGAITGKKIQEKPQGELPQTAIGLMQFCIQMMDNVTGISPDQFQASGANVPGVTMRQKGKSSLILLSKEFDALSRFREDEGYIVLDLLSSLADDRLIRIGGHADGKIVKLMRAPFTLEFDLFLDDTERDPNLRREYEESIKQLAPILIRQGMFIPEILDWMRLPFRFKKKLQNAIVAMDKARQQAAQQGIQQAGRGNPVSPEERAAKVQETQAKTAKYIAGAKRLESQSEKDRWKMLMDALSTAFEMQQSKAEGGTQQAKDALELFQKATSTGEYRPKPVPKSAAK